MRKLTVTLLAILAGACTATLPRHAVPADAAPTGFYEDQQRPDLALLEFRLARYFALGDRPYETVCAGDGKFSPHKPDALPKPLDPAVERKLLRRFPALTPLGGCKREGLSIIDTDTGVEAAVFDVHELECESAVRCSAWGGYYANGQHGWSWYWLDWNGSEWIISRRVMEIVLT